jgi:TRAP-type uncharacterized transport system substrate-binding protein
MGAVTRSTLSVSRRALRMANMIRVWVKDALVSSGPSIVLGLLALGIAWWFVDPAPPERIVISTGLPEDANHRFAERYRDILKRHRVTLELKASEGAMENLKRLADPESGVDVGFVQGGTTGIVDSPDLVSLGGVYYEPLWVFYRSDREIRRLSDLQGRRVAVGRDGSGTRFLATQMLTDSGVSRDEAQLLDLRGGEAAHALMEGEIDAAFFLMTADAPLIRRLMHLKNVRLMSLEHAEAYTRHFPFLHRLTLPRGSISIELDLPDRDVELVSPVVTLAARRDLHPALAYLLLAATREVHHYSGLFERRNEFPSDKEADLEISDEARRFFRSGTPFLQRYLPFWLATLVDRFVLIIVPLLAILIPLTRVVPAIYAWRVRSRIYRWYGELKFLEAQIQSDPDPARVPEYEERLEWIDERVHRIPTPLAFSEHLYVMREHIELVRNRLVRLSERHARRAGAAGQAEPPPG